MHVLNCQILYENMIESWELSFFIKVFVIFFRDFDVTVTFKAVQEDVPLIDSLNERHAS